LEKRLSTPWQAKENQVLRKISAVRFLNAKITSTISISLVLVLLGITLLILFMGNGLSRFVKENMSFNVMLSSSVSDA